MVICAALVLAVVGIGTPTEGDDLPVLLPVANHAFRPRVGAGVVWHNDYLYVMGGSDNVASASNVSITTYFQDVYRSHDRGVTWDTLSNASWSARAYFGTVSYDGSLYVYGGQGPWFVFPESCLNDVYVTQDDALTWQYLTLARLVAPFDQAALP